MLSPFLSGVRMPAIDLLVVQEGLVAALQVLDEVLAVGGNDLGVFPADGVGRQNNPAFFRAAANDYRLVAQAGASHRKQNHRAFWSGSNSA